MKTKPLVIIIITLIVIGAVSFFLIKPVISSIFSSWKELAQTKTNLKIIQEKKQVLDSLSKDANLNKIADIAQKYIPQETESGQLIIELTAMAQTNNLKVEQTSLEKSKESSQSPVQESTEVGKTKPTPTPTTSPSEEAKTVEFSLKLAGAFPDFMNFLKTIETSTRLIMIDDISMQAKVGSDNAVTFSAQIGGVTYYKNDVSLSPDLENIKISPETIAKFLNLKTYGQPINLPSESGFGRTNPFEEY